MKFLSLIFLIVITGCNSEYKTVEKKFPNGTTAIEYVYPNKENKNNYNIIEYYDNGKVAFKGFVENDKFVRIKLNYYDNGNLESVDSIMQPCNLNDCCCDGKVFKYYANGKLKKTFELKNGVGNGLVTFYFEDSSGKKNITYTYKDDLKNGPFISYYPSGAIFSKGEYRNDIAIGKHYIFKENGDTLKIYHTYNGKDDFPLKKWLKNGEIFYATYIDSSYNKVLYRWTTKEGVELKKEIILPNKDEYVIPN